MSLQYPVIFVHGILVTGDFYKKYTPLQQYLESLGVDFHVYKRPYKLTLEQREQFLHQYLEQNFNGERFHLIGHSAGGIDSRAVLNNRPGVANRCISLTTIGTPHRGSPIADGILHAEKECPFVSYLMGEIDGGHELAYELSSIGMEEFNEKTPNYPTVKYYSLPCIIDRWWKSGPTNWRGYKYLKDKGYPDNDGVVPFSSQVWGHSLGTFFADHKAQTAPFMYNFTYVWDNVFKICIDNLVELEQTLE